MEYQEYILMDKLENIHWFFLGRKKILNTLLFPIALFLRIVKKILHISLKGSDLNLNINPLLNKILLKIFSFESVLLKKLNFPFGLSIFFCYRI